MSLKDVISSHLREDPRIERPPLAEKRVFRNKSYEMHLITYPGIPGHKVQFLGLVVAAIVYRDEGFRIQLKMREMGDNESAESAIEAVFDKMTAEGKGPFDFVRDAKRWTGTPFTHEDLNNLLEAGFDERGKD